MFIRMRTFRRRLDMSLLCPEGDYLVARSTLSWTQNSALRRDIRPHIAAGKSPSSRYGLRTKVMAETRKLAAMLAADVVGYSRLTGADDFSANFRA